MKEKLQGDLWRSRSRQQEKPAPVLPTTSGSGPEPPLTLSSTSAADSESSDWRTTHTSMVTETALEWWEEVVIHGNVTSAIGHMSTGHV